ncbi:MAG TPA: radical SAM protein [Anaeromyxobacteraceae bacterium]|nr:radical SAM protein [Anaeromyxobacteraceae bacterium]
MACETDVARSGDGPVLRAFVDLGFPCNLCCPTCSRPRTVSVARGTAGALAAHLAEAVEASEARRVAAVWYGGEPLLDLDGLARASSQVRAACARRGARYEGFTVTNGTLLDDRAAVTLAAAGIVRAQVTLAGPQPVHDLRRPLLGAGSFRLILRNLRAARNRIALVIRFDLPNGNGLSTVTDLVRLLEENGLFEEPHPATVILGRPGSYAGQARALLDFGLPAPVVSFPSRSPDPMPAG